MPVAACSWVSVFFVGGGHIESVYLPHPHKSRAAEFIFNDCCIFLFFIVCVCYTAVIIIIITTTTIAAATVVLDHVEVPCVVLEEHATPVWRVVSQVWLQ